MTTLATLTTVKPTTALRAFYFSAGAACAAGGYWGMRRVVWASARASAAELAPAAAAAAAKQQQQQQQQDLITDEPLLGPKARGALGARWNAMVDATLGELARALGRRGI
jgi:hypothetical protein